MVCLNSAAQGKPNIGFPGLVYLKLTLVREISECITLLRRILLYNRHHISLI